jgi:cell wall-associated NlpC family hydrolase
VRVRGLAFIVLGVILLAAAGGTHVLHKKAARKEVLVPALAYARDQLGKPYQWGATGPGAFDCSGLVYRAYDLPWSLRTSQEQWAGLVHVRTPRPGDLVYFDGLLSPGETPPGHVGIVTGPHEMIDAYAAGFPVEYDSFGLPDSKPGLSAPVGYTDP